MISGRIQVLVATLLTVTFADGALATPLECIDYADTAGPTIHAKLGRDFWYMVVDGDLAVVLDDDTPLQIWQVTDPDRPLLLGEVPLGFDNPYLVVVHDRRAYVSARDSLVCVDFSNPLRPRIAGTLHVESQSGALTTMCPTDDFFYEIVHGAFLTIDVRDPAAMTIVGETPITSFSESMTVAGDRAYVGAEGSGFFVVDITDPTAPAVIHADANLRHIKDFIVRGDRTYALKRDELLVLDTSRPEGPVVIDSLALPHPAGILLERQNQLIAVGRDRIQLIDLGVPDRPGYLGAIATLGGHVAGLLDGRPVGWRGNHLVTFEVSLPQVRVVSLDIPYVVESAPLNDQVVAWCGRERLYTVDVSDATAPTILGDVAVSMPSDAFVVVGDHGYIILDDGELEIFDLSEPTEPVRAGSFLPEDFTLDGRNTPAASGHHLYLLSLEGDLEVFDVGDPVAPVHVGHLTVSAWPAYTLTADQDLACIATSDGTIHTIDISDPCLPRRLGSSRFGEFPAWCLALAGTRLYVGTNEEGLLIVDVSQPSAPRFVGACRGAGSVEDIGVDGDIVYLAGGPAGFHVVDCQDPAAPRYMGSVPSRDQAHRVTVMPDHVVFAGEDLHIAPLHCVETVDVVDRAPTPTPANLTAAPNPFNPHTVLRFELPAAGPCDLAIHDLRGRRLRILHQGSLPAGTLSLTWDGRDGHGRPLPSGMYVARLRHPGGIATTKLVLQK